MHRPAAKTSPRRDVQPAPASPQGRPRARVVTSLEVDIHSSQVQQHAHTAAPRGKARSNYRISARPNARHRGMCGWSGLGAVGVDDLDVAVCGGELNAAPPSRQLALEGPQNSDRFLIGDA